MTDVALRILIALAGGKHHGYAIMQDLDIYPGTLYANIKRLLEDHLIAEVGDDAARRRLYRITPAGREAAAVELARLEQIVRSAKVAGIVAKVRA